MDKPVIAVLNNNPRVMIDEEFDAYNEKFKFRRPKNNETVTTKKALELINDSEGCITCWRSPQLTSELLDAAPKLKIIAHAAGTLRPYVSDAVWGRGIKLVNAAGCIAEEVAQYVAALVVVGQRNLMEMVPQTAAGKWRDLDLYRPPRDVRGIKVGIIGAGEVGRRVLAMLKNFQVDLLLYDPFVAEKTVKELGAEKVELEELFTKSDVVTVHAPSNEHTKHLVNSKRLSLMRDGAVFINTSRGPLVDQEALVLELQRKRIWAFLDVTDPEPPLPDSILFGCPNLTLSTHVAGSIEGSGRFQLRWVLKEIERLFTGKPLLHEQSREMIEMSSTR